MTISWWLSLSLVCLLGAMSPGPSLTTMVKHSLAGGRINGLAAAWAHAAGIGVYALLTVAGLSYALAQAQWLFQGIAIAGAAYLAYLGVKALRSSGGVASSLEAGTVMPVWQSAKEGALISLLNPKIALFFIALFSQFIHPESTLSAQAVLVATPVLIDGLWYTLISLLLSRPNVLQTLRSKAILIDRLSGAVLMALAIRVLVTI